MTESAASLFKNSYADSKRLPPISLFLNVFDKFRSKNSPNDEGFPPSDGAVDSIIPLQESVESEAAKASIISTILNSAKDKEKEKSISGKDFSSDIGSDMLGVTVCLLPTTDSEGGE